MGHFRPWTDTWGYKAHFMGQFLREMGAPREEIDAATSKVVREGIAAQADAEKHPKRKRRRSQ